MVKEDPTKVAKADGAPEPTSFISSGKGESSADSTYNDFFQETSDGNISMGPKVQKSGIEIFTMVLGYIIPLAIIAVLIGAFHVYIQKGGGATSIKENYTFLCSYLNYSLDNIGEEYKCDPLQNIDASYSKKKTELEQTILTQLNEYIPIKLTKNILLSSPERKFAMETYKNKIRMDIIMEQFEKIRTESRSISESVTTNNIVCNGVSITGKGYLTTQCTIYGSASGNDDENGRLGSARIEVIRFLSNLADTSKSQFILLNPPTSLSMENIRDEEDFEEFETRTTVSIQAVYVPFSNTEKF